MSLHNRTGMALLLLYHKILCSILCNKQAWIWNLMFKLLDKESKHLLNSQSGQEWSYGQVVSNDGNKFQHLHHPLLRSMSSFPSEERKNTQRDNQLSSAWGILWCLRNNISRCRWRANWLQNNNTCRCLSSASVSIHQALDSNSADSCPASDATDSHHTFHFNHCFCPSDLIQMDFLDTNSDSQVAADRQGKRKRYFNRNGFGVAAPKLLSQAIESEDAAAGDDQNRKKRTKKARSFVPNKKRLGIFSFSSKEIVGSGARPVLSAVPFGWDQATPSFPTPASDRENQSISNNPVVASGGQESRSGQDSGQESMDQRQVLREANSEKGIWKRSDRCLSDLNIECLHANL